MKPVLKLTPLKCIIPKITNKLPMAPLKILTARFGLSPAKANDLPNPAPNNPIKPPSIKLRVMIPKEANKP